MKPVNEMTDQELNEWVGEKLMGWKLKVIKASNGKIIRWHKPNNQVSWGYDEIIFFPAEDLNHAHLMEKKIKEMPEYSFKCTNPPHGVVPPIEFYIQELIDIVNANPWREGGLFDYTEFFKFANASARQRCEAAFLAFSEK